MRCIRGWVDHGARWDSGIVYVMLSLRGVVGNGMEGRRIVGIAGHLRIHVCGAPMVLGRYLHGHLLKLVWGDESLVGGWIAGTVEAIWSHAVELQADTCGAWP